MSSQESRPIVRLGLPKGRMDGGVNQLLHDAGIHTKAASRTYRPTLSFLDFEAKILKPQNIVEMLHVGSRDIGFTGADWVAELEADVVELLDTGLDPVRLVAALRPDLLENGQLPQRRLIVASEYERLTKNWIKRQNIDAIFVRSYGATEVFPPEDADIIIDNTATGSTLVANGLVVYDEVMTSSTRLYANASALEDTYRKEVVDHFVLLLESVLEARKRVMIVVNVSADQLESLIAILPCMKEPTVARLHGDGGYAITAAVPREELPHLLPGIKARGGTDIVVTPISQIVP